MKNLHGKTAVITGGASGIGQGIAFALARNGVDIAIADLHDARGEEVARTARSLGVKALFVHCDVGEDLEVQALREKVLQTFGRMDLLVNNVGILAGGAFENIPLHAWRRCLDINFISSVRCTQIFLPHLRHAGRGDGGHIVNTASLSALFANEPMLMPYAASKAALVSLTETLAVTLQPDNIGVTCLCPGAVPTNMAEHVTLYGDVGGLGIFAGRHVRVRSTEEIGLLTIQAIMANQFLVTSDDTVRDVQQMRAADPDRFVVAMGNFFTGEADFPI